MKPKYHGIFSVLVFLAAFGLVAGYGLMNVWRPAQGPGTPPALPAPKTELPSAGQVAEVSRLSEELIKLANPASAGEAHLAMSLFGQSPSNRTAREQAQPSRADDHHLSVTLLAGMKRFCIVDGDFLAQGARLPDGFLVEQIEHKRIQLIREGERQWIFLEEYIPGSVSSADRDQKGSS